MRHARKSPYSSGKHTGKPRVKPVPQHKHGYNEKSIRQHLKRLKHGR